MVPTISPMTQLMQGYSSAETGIMLVSSLQEFTPDLIIDRGEDRNRGLHRYHVAKATMDHVCMVVMAQQIFVWQAAALMVEGKSQFIVNPKDTLIPILQGTNSLSQLYVAWKALIARMRLGVKTWEKYVAKYQLQLGAHSWVSSFFYSLSIPPLDFNFEFYLLVFIPTTHSPQLQASSFPFC